jgi:hypothetical protein
MHRRKWDAKTKARVVLEVWVPKTRRSRQPADWGPCHHAARRS